MARKKAPRYDGTRRKKSPVVIEEDRVGVVQCSPTRCVLAKAWLRQPGVVDVRVGAQGTDLLTKRGWERSANTPNTAAAIKAYDNEGALMPVGFVAEIEPPKRPLGSRSGGPQGSGKRSGTSQAPGNRQPSKRNMNVEPPT